MSSTTPLYNALREIVQKEYARFYMPGHKGIGLSEFGEILKYDITEITGADSLYEACTVIAQVEEHYSQLYGSFASILSAGGATLCIQTMLTLAVPIGAKIIAGRNIHASAVNTFAMLDLTPIWLYPDTSGGRAFSGRISPKQVQAAIEENPDCAGVYITSPDYFGVISDIEAIAAICHQHNIPLLVDNAHGAHLKFGERPLHPMALGADMCCDSLHKTLPVLTGGAVLHIQNPNYAVCAKQIMSLYGSTSPSYLILLSCDLVTQYLEDKIGPHLKKVAQRVEQLRQLAAKKGFLIPNGICDPYKLSICFAELGYTKEQFHKHLADYLIEAEYISDHSAVFMPTGFNSERDFQALKEALVAVKDFGNRGIVTSELVKPTVKMSIRQAAFSPRHEIEIEEAEGKIVSGMVNPCPPGIPIIMSGEHLDNQMVKILKNYGIRRLFVI